ncbi:MAG: GMC oxidoreductase, partial [Pseudomonadota bacterium]
LRGNGHAPYRLPVAIAYRPGCGECQGQRCARACKGEGWTRVLADTSAQHRVVIRCSTHVRTLAAEVDGMVRLDLAGPHRQSIRARRVVLAAGALNTPRLLLNSPDLFEREPHPMIGRGLMFHSSDLFTVGVSPGLASDGPKKTMALRDFYDLPEGRGGEIQSLGFDLAPRLVSRYLSELVAARGIPGGPYLMAALRIPATVMARWLGEPPVLATILEDLPYTENRVLAAPEAYAADQPIQVSYTVKPELEARAMAMRRAIGAAFAPMKVTFLLSRIAPNLGHPCGTVRMGDAPETDPVDAKGRLRGVAAQIYVADASVLPSSGGVNPGLTVAANALRIAEALTSGHALPQGAAGRWSNARAS